ncbi:MAG: septal ring lytic transglycosylase RlpA family protein [Gammaproteobacteria bacterium]|nr:septal ring lytic transglycosylase RlpA family protein [Gammaproteobacteria bacterium]
MSVEAFCRWRRTLALCAAGLIGGCAVFGPPDAGPTPTEVEDGPPAPSEVPYDLGRLPDPVPSVEPPSRYGNPPSYEVEGTTYYPVKSAAGYRAEGIASWYGTKFHGRRTSSGETYDMFKLTAAHRTLPIPTYVRVTNLENGRRTLVRVNDRGPFHDDRMLDLSYAAAVKLGFSRQGTARVRVEAVDGTETLFLQAGAFRGKALAEQLQRNLATLTGEQAEVVQQSDDALYRVLIGPLVGEQRAKQLQSLIVAANHAMPLILRIRSE